MISRVEAFRTEDGQIHASMELALRHETELSLRRLCIKIADELGRDPDADDVRKSLLSNGPLLLSILNDAFARGIKS